MIEVLDLSRYQGSPDFARVRDAGIAAVYLKATEGATYVDPRFRRNYDAACAAGIRVGVYHFFRMTSTPQAQADAFLRELGAADLLPALDIEVKDHAANVAITDAALAWLELVTAAVGARPLVYTYASFGGVFASHPEIAAYPLWVASYAAHDPAPCGPWGTAWQLWQYTSRGACNGVTGFVDRSRARALPILPA